MSISPVRDDLRTVLDGIYRLVANPDAAKELAAFADDLSLMVLTGKKPTVEDWDTAYRMVISACWSAGQAFAKSRKEFHDEVHRVLHRESQSAGQTEDQIGSTLPLARRVWNSLVGRPPDYDPDQ